MLVAILLASPFLPDGRAWGETKLDPRWGHIYQWERGIKDRHGENFPAFLIVQKGLDMMYYNPESNPFPKEIEIAEKELLKGYIPIQMPEVSIEEPVRQKPVVDLLDRGRKAVEPKCRWEVKKVDIHDHYSDMEDNKGAKYGDWEPFGIEWKQRYIFLKRKVCE